MKNVSPNLYKQWPKNPFLINNEKLSDPRFDPEYKFRQSLRVSEREVKPTRRSLDYSARTYRGFNDTCTSVF